MPSGGSVSAPDRRAESGATFLRIVAGKGGVGRTTVTAALASRAAARGRRVLAVDAVGTGDLERLVAASPGAAPFDTLRLTTSEAIDQYLRIYLRLPIGVRRIGPLARIFDYVSVAAPGVQEILIIGKIGWEVRNGGWDEVIVDGPATGHAVELLDAPRTMAELVPTGPLAEQTGWLRQVLSADRTGVVVVAAPDELSVSEAGELIERIESETETAVRQVVANRQPLSLSPDGQSEAERLAGRDDPLGRLAALALDRHDAAHRGLERLRSATVAGGGVPVVEAIDRPSDPVGAVVSGLDQGPSDGWST